MLSISKMATGSEQYYLDTVASGLEEYYTGAGEAPGVWLGTAGPDLGLAGKVTPEQLRAVLAGCSPIDGSNLTASRVPADRRVAGFDFTFSAPKSVSVLYGLGSDDVSEAVRDAHDDAVRDALLYIESHAAYARRGHAGVVRLETSGLVAGGFRHRTSRGGDPQLHTHVLVANLVHGSDGRWSSLYAGLAYQQARTAGFVYQAALRAGLVSRLGVSFGRVVNGSAEIAGMPRNLLKEFSTRRAEIEARLEEFGGTSRRTRALATLETRRAKEVGGDNDLESLHDVWRRRSLDAGIDPNVIQSVLGRTRAPMITVFQSQSVAKELLAPDGLTANVSAFERRDAVRAVAERLPDGGRVDAVEWLTDSVLADDEVVTLDREGRAGERLRTTKEMLQVESRLLHYGSEMRLGRAGVPVEIVEAVLSVRPGIADEQAAMVRRLTTSGDGLQVVVGKAGAGKTYALDAARAAWQRAGFSVQGTALSARAAAELEAGAGIASCTLARFMQTDNLMSLTCRDVIVVDEAGMVGTRALEQLMFWAKSARASVVLVGDHRQLPEIEAGGALRMLGEHLGALELTENRRQHEGWERQALDELRHGNVVVGVVAYEEHGRLHLCDSARSARVAMVKGWADSRGEAADSRMYAISRADVEELNRLARDELRRRGELGDDVLLVGSRGYAIGDEVLFCRNDRHLGVLNGMRGTVSVASEAGLVVDTDRGAKSVGLEYLEEGHLAHGYASTVHKAQGATVDRAFVLGGDALYREAGYVAMSRARERTELFVITSAFDDGLAPDESSPGLVKALSASRAKQLAVESLEPARDSQQAYELEQMRRPPGDERSPESVEELESAARIRERLLGESAAVRRPEHLVAEIGDVPELPAERSRWVRAAGAIESFRERFGFGERSSTLRREGLPIEVQDEREALLEFLGALDPAYVPGRERDRSMGLSL